jgi:pSer/pThr/pTyr-binding forkhead associated (FHA) protein
MKASGSGPTLATEITAPIVTPDEHASGRLVILSKTMAGREFVLDKPAMVIGRTEENDIWVNHRSISRHHAKVVRENGNYAIVDLQSANGVRVNGEEYGKVELRTRDVVDLGHVRFRFVAPNEDFLFGRDAQPVDIATEGQSSKLLWAAVGLLLLGVVAFLILSGDKKESGSNSGKDTPIKAIIDDPPLIDDPPPLPAVVNDASVGSTANSANDAQIATYLNQANSAETGESWGALAQAANKILELDPANPKAKALLAKAELEKTSQKSYEKFTTSLAKTPKKYVLAAAAFDEIDEGSVYKGQAEDLHEQAKAEFGAEQRAAAGRAVAQKGKSCQNAIALILSNVPNEWVSVSKEIRGFKCSKDTSRPPNNTTNNNTKPPPPPPPKDLGPPIEELVEQAEDAVKNTQYGKGSRLCRQALERDPNNQKAITACAIAACNLKNGSAAKKYVRRIKSSQRRQGLKQICLRLGVTGFDE